MKSKQVQEFNKTIPSNWRTVSFSEIVEVSGGTTPDTRNPEYWNGDIPWLTPKDITKKSILHVKKTSRKITQSGLENGPRNLNPSGCVLMTSRAPVGIPVINDIPMAVNQGFIVINCKNIDNHFLYYWVKNNIEYLKSASNGTTFLELSKSNFKLLKISLPKNKAEEEKIGKILYDLDSKIENLQKQNKVLEQTVQIIFKSLFVDFDGQTEFEDSELGNIPKGWTIELFGNIFQITDYTANGSFAGLKENITYSYVPDYAILVRQVDFNNHWNGNYVYVDKHSYDFLKKSFLNAGDIMISNIGANYGTTFFVPDLEQPMTGAPNVLIVKTEDFNREFAYCYLLSNIGKNTIDSIVTGSAVPKFNKTDFRNIQLIYPNKKSICNFHHHTLSIRKLIQKNEIQLKILQTSRDLLLPKLMSGEIRV